LFSFNVFVKTFLSEFYFYQEQLKKRIYSLPLNNQSIVAN